MIKRAQESLTILGMRFTAKVFLKIDLIVFLFPGAAGSLGEDWKF